MVRSPYYIYTKLEDLYIDHNIDICSFKYYGSCSIRITR